MPVKIRKVGNSKVLTVPKGIKVLNKEFDVFSGRQGAIVYLPVETNPFDDPKSLTKYGQAHDDNTGLVDAEVNNSEIE